MANPRLNRIIDIQRRQEADFLRNLDAAHAAAGEVYEDPTQGPWTYGDFVESIMERSGVKRELAVNAEDALLTNGALIMDHELMIRRATEVDPLTTEAIN